MFSHRVSTVIHASHFPARFEVACKSAVVYKSILITTITVIAMSCTRQDASSPTGTTGASAETRALACENILGNALTTLILQLDPWDASGSYTRTSWDKLIAVARIAQECPPDTLELALARSTHIVDPAAEFQSSGGTYDPRLRSYLLLRMMFALPESAPSAEHKWYVGLPNLPQDSDWVNIAWPLQWNNGEPSLVAGWVATFGPPYAVVSEYRAFREKYPMRVLPDDNKTNGRDK